MANRAGGKIFKPIDKRRSIFGIGYQLLRKANERMNEARCSKNGLVSRKEDVAASA